MKVFIVRWSVLLKLKKSGSQSTEICSYFISVAAELCFFMQSCSSQFEDNDLNRITKLLSLFDQGIWSYFSAF